MSRLIFTGVCLLVSCTALVAGPILYSNVDSDPLFPEFSQGGPGTIFDQVIVTADRAATETVLISRLSFGIDVFTPDPVAISAWYAAMLDDGTLVNPLLIGTRSLSGMTGLRTVVFGDGASTLFEVVGNQVAFSADFPGSRAFYVGLSFSSPADAGWRVANGPIPGRTPDSFWVYDPPVIDGLAYYGGSPHASFAVEAEGVVPEPGTVVFVGVGAALIACRRLLFGPVSFRARARAGLCRR